jgi:hypothetical protein
MRRVFAPVVVAACLPCLGCSFGFVSGPPSDPSEEQYADSSRCTTSVLIPVLDTASAAVGAINIGIAANASPGEVTWYGVEMESETGVALGITQLAAFGAGAVYGFIQTSRCRAHLDAERNTPDEPKWSPEVAPGSPPPRSEVSPVPPPSNVAPAPTQTAPSSPPAASSSPPTTSTPPASPSAQPPTVSFPE